MKQALLVAAVLAVAMALGGCSTAPVEKVVTVQVKVKEPCISNPPARPAYQTGKGAYPGDKQAAAMLAADFEKAELYGTNWEAAAAGCLVVPPQRP